MAKNKVKIKDRNQVKDQAYEIYKNLEYRRF